eukprot:scaffold117624_cov43-Cyclotella_meneghiniana.AAC.3
MNLSDFSKSLTILHHQIYLRGQLCLYIIIESTLKAISIVKGPRVVDCRVASCQFRVFETIDTYEILTSSCLLCQDVVNGPNSSHSKSTSISTIGYGVTWMYCIRWLLRDCRVGGRDEARLKREQGQLLLHSCRQSNIADPTSSFFSLLGSLVNEIPRLIPGAGVTEPRSVLW